MTSTHALRGSMLLLGRREAQVGVLNSSRRELQAGQYVAAPSAVELTIAACAAILLPLAIPGPAVGSDGGVAT